ncbi:acyltransferase [Companilactobacillus allii]|uniref:Galactoside O-acetyltransferase n=1 Tax=Companilactobacillus allii TaxID=1847728 RepID=A0A1P8Q260_9LACO|nr:acyltransferase [Companilactobacillus allii]APX71962.1 galactoside O-acetyltransferase [Companilactobacillus allii]USQ69058.1 acyltransferase [Companilactobacillus allii]
MVKINGKITSFSKYQIYQSALRKVSKGFIYNMFFRKNFGTTFIGKQVNLFNKQYMNVGKNVKFEDYSEIQGLSKQGLFFADNVTIGRGVQIRPSSYYGVGNIGQGLCIGKNSSIGPNGYIGCAGMIIIGNEVMIGPNVTIIAENHNFNNKKLDIKDQGVNQQGITIKDNVWIGANVTILDGVTIESGSIIGASTLVTKDVPGDTVFFNKRENHFDKR